jgi:hypothetical protein
MSSPWSDGSLKISSFIEIFDIFLSGSFSFKGSITTLSIFTSIGGSLSSRDLFEPGNLRSLEGGSFVSYSLGLPSIDSSLSISWCIPPLDVFIGGTCFHEGLVFSVLGLCSSFARKSFSYFLEPSYAFSPSVGSFISISFGSPSIDGGLSVSWVFKHLDLSFRGTLFSKGLHSLRSFFWFLFTSSYLKPITFSFLSSSDLFFGRVIIVISSFSCLPFIFFCLILMLTSFFQEPPLMLSLSQHFILGW